jgi:hypothetical protein
MIALDDDNIAFVEPFAGMNEIRHSERLLLVRVIA